MNEANGTFLKLLGSTHGWALGSLLPEPIRIWRALQEFAEPAQDHFRNDPQKHREKNQPVHGQPTRPSGAFRSRPPAALRRGRRA